MITFIMLLACAGLLYFGGQMFLVGVDILRSDPLEFRNRMEEAAGKRDPWSRFFIDLVSVTT